MKLIVWTFGAVLLAAMIAASVWGWSHTPADAQFPMHWNLKGEVDRYGSRTEGLIFLPAAAALVLLLGALVPKIEPLQANLMRSIGLWRIVIVGAVALLAAIHAMILLTAAGVMDAAAMGADATLRVIVGAVSLLLLILGERLGKVRPNFFLGVRTPWTLTSDLAWEKTHRWAGRGLFLVGAAGLALAILAPARLALSVQLGGVLTVAVLATVYSYIVWRRDPHSRNAPEEA